MWKMSERKWGDFNCPYASNPYHDCSEFCFEEVSEKLQNDGIKQVQGKRKKKFQRTSKALKPSYSCAGNLFSMNSRSYHGRTKAMWVITDKIGVHPDCKNTSNPYHICAEYCFNNVLNRDQAGQVMKLNHLEGDKAFSTRGRTGLQSHCIYASIPKHECTEVCFQNGPDNNIHKYALNPKEEIKTLVAAESRVKHECQNDEYCSENLSEDHGLEGMMKAKEEKEVVFIPQREVTSSDENTSDSFIEYCFKSDPEKDQPGLAANKSIEESKIESQVNPECEFASNPYHMCAEYCFQSAPERERHRHGKKLRGLMKMVSNKETTNVHLQCKFASNPYHECSRICFQNELGWNNAERASMKLRKENKVVSPGERGVYPECQFASNPYHVCTEYCIQNESVKKKNGSVMKLNDQRELKKETSNKKSTNVLSRCKFASNSYHECDLFCFQNELDQNIAEGVTESEEGKKETSYALTSDVSTKSKFGSNSFHKFSEYCSEEHPDKDQLVECIPVFSEENRNSHIEKSDHLIMDKSNVNMEFVESSKPIYNNVESSLGIILPEFVETPNTDSDYTEFSEEITTQAIITKDLMTEKYVETEITRQTSDVQQPLQVDVSDLVLEWAKYCSKEKTPEYKIVTQEMRAFKIKDGQDNDSMKRHDSSNLEKFKAVGSLQRSLPISILFSIGFLVALFKWTQMVLSLVMPSERSSSSGRVMRKKHV